MTRAGSLLLLIIFAAVALALFIPLQEPAPRNTSADEAAPSVMGSIPPLAMILQEIVGSDVAVDTLLGPSDSPHTYDPVLSDVRRVRAVRKLYYVSQTLDGWIEQLPTQAKQSAFALLPRSAWEHWPHLAHGSAACSDPSHHHHHAHAADSESGAENALSHFDPHFWTDPLTVKALVPMLLADLQEMFPEQADQFAENAAAFTEELDVLHAEAQAQLAPHAGKRVFLFHPSFLYLLNRYDLEYGGSVEEFPGKEPTPRYLNALMERIRTHEAQAIFTEPQLSKHVAESLSQRLDIAVRVLDPLGGVAGRQTYAELFRYNVRVLAEALE
jgi:zinc transport system substrate-binding protein